MRIVNVKESQQDQFFTPNTIYVQANEFQSTKRVCLICAVWQNPVIFFPSLGDQIYSDSPDSIVQQRKSPKSWKTHILDKSMYNQILIHFHIQPLLWMNLHCESTSRNHLTELPYEHWEQHHCTGRNQPCSLCNTNPYCQFQSLTSHQLQSLSILHESVFRSQYIQTPSNTFFAKTTLGPGFVSVSPARIIRIARLVPFEELKQRNFSKLLRLLIFLMLVKQYEDPSANTLLPILQSKFGSAESEPFAHFQRIKPRTTTTGNMTGSLLTWNLAIFYGQFLQNQQQSCLQTRETGEQRWWGRDPTNVSNHKVPILCLLQSPCAGLGTLP